MSSLGHRTAVLLAVLPLLLSGCAATQQLYRRQQISEVVYARPQQELCDAVAPLLEKRHLGVARRGCVFISAWKADDGSRFTQLRVQVEAVDAHHSQLRALRVTRVGSNLGASNIELTPGAKGIGQAGWKSTLQEAKVETASLRYGEGNSDGDLKLVKSIQRDLDLEESLLAELDGQTAKQIAAEAKAAAGQDDGRARVRLDAKAKATIDWACPRDIVGGHELVVLRRMVLVGEQHGTNEVPQTVGDLACAAVRVGIPVTLALELPATDQAKVDEYLHSDGSHDAQRRFVLRGDAWRRMYDDGRTSAALLELIDRARRLRGSGVPVSVVFFDAAGQTGSERDAQMATVLELARAQHRDDLMLVLTGNVHVPKHRGAEWDSAYVPMGLQLANLGVRPLSLDLAQTGGNAWACELRGSQHYDCGPHWIAPNTNIDRNVGLANPVPVRAMKTNPQWSQRQAVDLAMLRASVRVNPEPDERGLDGFVFVGSLSASPPAAQGFTSADLVAVAQEEAPQAGPKSVAPPVAPDSLAAKLVPASRARFDLDALACAGSAACLTRRGWLHESAEKVEAGETFELLPDVAAALYEQACDRGDAQACGALGSMVAEGRGTTQNLTWASELSARACSAKEHPSASACFNLARAREQGNGVAADLGLALALDAEACRLGEKQGCASEERLRQRIDELQARLEKNRVFHALPEVERERLRPRLTACLSGGAAACNDLGVDAAANRPPDWSGAEAFFREACQGEDASACYNLALLLLGRHSVTHRTAATARAEARTLLQTACGKGISPACNTLAHAQP